MSLGLHSFAVQRVDGTSVEARVLVRYAADGQAKSSVILGNQAAVSASDIVPVRIYPDLDRFCLRSTAALPQAAPGLGIPRMPDVRNPPAKSPELVDIIGSEVVKIRVEGEAHNCGSACRARVGVVFLHSLAQWFAGCVGCNPAVVEVDLSQYVATRYVERANFLRLSLPSDKIGVQVGRLRQSARFENLMSFQRADGAVAELDLCRENPPDQPGQAALPKMLAPMARQRLCGKPVPCTKQNRCIEIPIHLAGSRSCSDNFIAWGQPDLSVTLNSHKFQYGVSQRRGASVGQSLVFGVKGAGQEQSIPLAPFALHEVGHWFGLKHVDPNVGADGRHEVMTSVGNVDAVCISAGALDALAKAVDRRADRLGN